MEMQSEARSANENTFFSTAYICREMGRTVMVMRGTMTVMMIDLPNAGTELKQNDLIVSMRGI